MKSYLEPIAILLSMPLGYIVNYFCQSGRVRVFMSLGDYLEPMNVFKIFGGAAEYELAGVTTTARVVTILSVLVVGLICWYRSRKSAG